MVGLGTLRSRDSMKDHRYLLLVNDAIKTHLARMPADRRRQLREKLEFLENGIWDAGVRVKKLRGTPRVVFEARLNRARAPAVHAGPPPRFHRDLRVGAGGA